MSNGVVPAQDVWERLIASASTAILSLGEHGEIRLANEAATTLLQWSPDELASKHLADLLADEKDIEAGPNELLDQASRRGSVPFAQSMRRQDGSTVSTEGMLSLSSSTEGARPQYLLTIAEGTERSKLLLAAERANSELQQFAFTVSHDLKAPLRSVKSFSELLARRYQSALDQDASEYIAYIVGGAKEIEQLLNDVVSYSQAGREDKTRPQDVEATGVLQWAVMNVDAMVKQTGARITWDALPAVHADQGQLAQLLQHLLTNAMKFRGSDPPAIHVRAQDGGNGQVEFSVTDNGTGVDSQYHDRIFGVFKRLVGKEVPGTGIGLAICRKIVEAHGGRIWIESQPGKGSTFRFTLPAA